MNKLLELDVLCLAVILAIMLPGCDGPNDPGVTTVNEATLKTQGDKIGTLPDGRSIYRYEVKRGGGCSPHWLYVVSDGSSVTNNHHSNKANRVEVFIDGKKYILAEKP
jgi:hypothetical protein